MKFRSAVAALLMVLTASMVLSACGGAAATPAPAGKTISVDAAEFSFTPNKFDAKVGDQLAFKVNNKGTLDHTFVIYGPDGQKKASLTIALGTSATLNFSPDAAGTYNIECDVPGHKEAGMTATLTVTQ